ncbi:MAG TPA: BON domain-containing protein [Deltaproteobacteria bacterium]|jgi:osmotically-inducible protein OsmY|nr:BON domain-containing protein [Deltaproteobacteria bacterium]HQI00910.1 BON domain-containing protein [Deltaproteobacteria bacterium]
MAQTVTRNAEDIKRDVCSHLSWDDRINESNIRVEVADGTVILSGTVPTYSNLAQAEKDAYQISGVKSVDNRLTVLFPETSPSPADAEIASRVVDMLHWNPTIDDSGIHVSVLNGVVKLTGDVHSSWEKSRAGYIAINVEGAVGMENLLHVQPRAVVLDDEIRKDIEETLARNAFVDASGIRIEVKDGVVTLSGTVEDDRSRRIAERIARYTDGVRSVNDQLAIR